MNRFVLYTAVLLIAIGIQTSTAPSAPLLPFTVQAMYHLQQVGDPSAFSPDGTQVAFVVKRPLETARNMAEGDFLQDADLADIYLANLQSGRIEKITNGNVDSSGFWDPQWSPDGNRIAMLSTRGGNVYLWVWDRGSGLRRVTNRAIDIGFRTSDFTWVSNDRILCKVLPVGQRPEAMSIDTETPRIAMHEWPIDWRGQTPTANVLESGVPANVAARPQGALLLITVDGGTAQTQEIAHATHFDSLTLSRDLRYASVFSEVGILEPRAGRKLQSNFDNGIYTLSVYDTRTGARVAHFARRDVGTSPSSWSWDGKEIAVLGEPATTAYKSHLRVFRCTIATQSCANVLPAMLDVDSGPNGTKSAPLWSADGRLLVYADTLAGAKEGGSKDRWDWYSIGHNGSLLNLTASLSADLGSKGQFGGGTAPASLVTVQGGHRFVSIASGKLIDLFPDGQPPRYVPIAGAPQLTGIVWPVQPGTGASYVVATAGSANQDFFAINLATNRLTHLARLPTEASLSAFSPQTLSAVFTESLRNGSFIRYSYRGSSVKTLYSANTWLARYAEGRLVSFTYTSLDKEKLYGWILLPIDYQAGRRYPAVVWVYAGSVMSPKKKPGLTSINEVHALNLQFLPARGYAVIFPSMPLPPFGRPADPYPKLPNGVLPAVDKAVELGYVDGDRVGVMGQSYGGFSTYGLITQTNRFKAAVALAGISDWASLYGEYDGRQRYEDYINENDLFNDVLLEDGQGNFGDPPWVNPERYISNSPITYVARVHTPLMIIQGDLDYVAVQQGEQFFTALYRQGKRAEFVRYWGEEHVFRSEANIDDYWRRMIGWFNEFLR